MTFDLGTEQELARATSSSPVEWLLVSPDGDRVVTASPPGRLEVRDAATLASLVRIDLGEGPIEALAFGRGGRALVVGSTSGRLWILDPSAP